MWKGRHVSEFGSVNDLSPYSLGAYAKAVGRGVWEVLIDLDNLKVFRANDGRFAIFWKEN